jgi:hypothetical protein
MSSSRFSFLDVLCQLPTIRLRIKCHARKGGSFTAILASQDDGSALSQTCPPNISLTHPKVLWRKTYENEERLGPCHNLPVDN